MNRLKIFRSGEQQAAASGPKIISILSGKGGVGKSVIAYNLADRIASGGDKVLLVDCDLDCGSIHVLANSSPEHGIAEQTAGRISLKDASFAINDKLDILASIDQNVTSGLTEADKAAQFVTDLRRDAAPYEYVIIDHSSGKSAGSLIIAQGSDLNLLILVPELMSISDCYGLFKCLVNANPRIDCRLLMNRVRDVEEADQVSGIFSEMCHRFIGYSPGRIGHLPESADFTASVASQKPLAAVCDDQAPVLQALNKIVSEVTTDGTSIPSRGKSATIQQISNEPITADIKE